MPHRIPALIYSSAIFLIMFSRPVSAQAPPDTVRLLCIGNSITEGWMTSNPTTDAYPVQLAAMLGSGWQVMNAGVSGRTMLRQGDYPIWNEQKFKSGLAFNPNVVTILLGTNDSKPWNWDTLKSQFVIDYRAMIDTLRTLPAHPAIWVGLPAPSFHDTLGIRDSIIEADIIPMIRQVAAEKGCAIIDINTAAREFSGYFVDGIHPNTTGSERMAEVLYSVLTGKPVIHAADENCASGCTVTTSGSLNESSFGGGNLVDGSLKSAWAASGFPASATIDLGSTRKVDLLRLYFGSAAGAGYQFTIDAATAPGSWTPLIDSSARKDTAAFVLLKTDSIGVRYLRLTISGALHPKGDTVSIAEFSALAPNGGAHAPALSIRKISANALNVKYAVTAYWPKGSTGSIMMFQKTGANGTFQATAGLKPGATSTTQTSMKPGNINSYCAISFLNGIIAMSDTVALDTRPTGVDNTRGSGLAATPSLDRCYPNPFNPSTTISFSLPAKSFVTLRIFDILGKEVAVIVSEVLPAGSHVRTWDASGCASGTYFCTLSAGTVTETRKLTLVK